MANLRLEKVNKRFGRVEAIKNLNLDIRDGEFFCVLGPPGAGKTTTLRLIVGLERPDEGTVFIGDRVVNDVYPGERDIAIVFQNLALYPNRTVYENIAFPLRERKLPKGEIDERVRAAAKVLHIERLLDRKPAKLSGGERQRVAIGRAIVRSPQAYLMDEPLANLDARLRLEMRVELKHLQKDLGQTLVYVTHDQIEAMSMADRIAVLNKGVLQQVDVPDMIYSLPANCFVATVVGSPPMNFLACDIRHENEALQLRHREFVYVEDGSDHPLQAAIARQSTPPAAVLLGVRPEDIRVYDARPDGFSLPAQVSVIEPLGSETIVDLLLGAEIVKAIVPPTQVLREHEPVWITFENTKLHVFDAKSEARLYSGSKQQSLRPLGAANP